MESFYSLGDSGGQIFSGGWIERHNRLRFPSLARRAKVLKNLAGAPFITP
jgi:hypothetical protein